MSRGDHSLGFERDLRQVQQQAVFPIDSLQLRPNDCEMDWRSEPAITGLRPSPRRRGEGGRRPGEGVPAVVLSEKTRCSPAHFLVPARRFLLSLNFLLENTTSRSLFCP